MINSPSLSRQSSIEKVQVMRTKELWIEYQEGNQDAFNELVTRYTPAGYIVARKFLSQSADVEDAVQDAWLNVAKRGHTFDGSRKFGSWFRTVVANVCRDRWRSKKNKFTLLTGGVAGQDEHIFDVPDTHSDVEIGPYQDALHYLVAQLSEKYRIVIEAKINGLSTAEIASQIGREEGTVRWRVGEAIKIMKDLTSYPVHNLELERRLDDRAHAEQREHPNLPASVLGVSHLDPSISI